MVPESEGDVTTTAVLQDIEFVPAEGWAIEVGEFEEEFGDFTVEEIKAGGCSCTGIGTQCIMAVPEPTA